MKNIVRRGVALTVMLLLGAAGCAYRVEPPKKGAGVPPEKGAGVPSRKIRTFLGYDLGPVNGGIAGARSVQVNFFDNETLEPRLVAAVNHSLRQHLQQDGTFQVESNLKFLPEGRRKKADLVVSGVLKSFTRNGVNFKASDVLAVQDYSLQLTAQVIVKNRNGDEVYNRVIVGSSVVRVNTDFSSGQRQAVPLIADQLARRATSLIADGEWPGD